MRDRYLIGERKRGDPCAGLLAKLVAICADPRWHETRLRWIAGRAGALAKPPRTGSRRHRVPADGPGEYVHG